MSEIDRSLDNLFGCEGAKLLTRQRVSYELEQLTHKTEVATRNNVLMGLRSSQQVADFYRVSRQSINTRADRLRKEYGSFGWEVGRGWWVFTPDEVEQLRPGPPGRPKKLDNDQANHR